MSVILPRTAFLQLSDEEVKMTAEGGPTRDNVYTMLPFHVLDPVEYFDHKFGIVKLLIINEDVKVKCYEDPLCGPCTWLFNYTLSAPKMTACSSTSSTITTALIWPVSTAATSMRFILRSLMTAKTAPIMSRR